MDPIHLVIAEGELPLVPLKFYVDWECSEKNAETPGCSHVLVAAFHNLGVKSVHDDPASEILPELGGSSYVIHVAVGEDYGRYLGGIDPDHLNVLNGLVKTDSCPAVDQDKFAKIDEVYGAIACIGYCCAANLVDMINDLSWFHLFSRIR
jgi:hypothetical protein